MKRTRLWRRLRREYTGSESFGRGCTHVHLIVGCQYFKVVRAGSVRSGEWFRSQLATALERMVINERGAVTMEGKSTKRKP